MNRMGLEFRLQPVGRRSPGDLGISPVPGFHFQHLQRSTLGRLKAELQTGPVHGEPRVPSDLLVRQAHYRSPAMNRISLEFRLQPAGRRSPGGQGMSPVPGFHFQHIQRSTLGRLKAELQTGPVHGEPRVPSALLKGHVPCAKAQWNSWSPIFNGKSAVRMDDPTIDHC
jgi:hypothetical protein